MIRKAPVSMIMTENVITLKKKDSLEKAEQIFKKYNIRHLPVVTNNVVIGMLSKTDLLRLKFADYSDNDDQDTDVFVYKMFTVEQVMRQKIVSVTSSNSIKDVAEIFATREFHALPVIDNNQLVGIVTTTDVIRYLLSQF
ncbi:CBS domain-containing protein [Aestuariivivens sediminicola]|uniref:CBS domain-containing protein n=1 Tax=Aestuariivivens sediminicola TaxID=2913560 RepID=UPI001F56DE76|nr:CBS domain-containing protein [Aestuariivivens sediminicola]